MDFMSQLKNLVGPSNMLIGPDAAPFLILIRDIAQPRITPSECGLVALAATTRR